MIRAEEDDWVMVNSLPKLISERIETNVGNRFAKTLISRKVENVSGKSQEATFSVVTPDQAFISGFTLEVDGKLYESSVKEKEEAKKAYDSEVAQGHTAAHVATTTRDSNRFSVSVNIEPKSKVGFHLRYEELLTRKDNKYELIINMQLGQFVDNFEIVVNIEESCPLKFVKVPNIRSGNEAVSDKPDLDPGATIKATGEKGSKVTFKPTIEEQKHLSEKLYGKEGHGLVGQFVVQYDVVRDPQGGEVLIDETGYFIHFFIPEDLPPLNKDVVFVLDVSGSMQGQRITQLKQAMNSILTELKPDDTFSIIEFNTDVSVWNIETAEVAFQQKAERVHYFGGTPPEPQIQRENSLPSIYKATASNVENARKVIEKMYASGGTDILSALTVGLNVIVQNKAEDDRQSIIVFLTDGEPTCGDTNTDSITKKVTELNTKKVPLFTLSFGDGADREFLQKISLKNQGFSKHIYEAADASLQLQDFYKQICSPLLSNIQFKYVDKVKNLTRNYFPVLFDGTELCTSGIATPGFVPPPVEGWGRCGRIQFKPCVIRVPTSLERLWAYLTIKNLLEKRKIEDNKELTKKALELALKYSFVTEVSSLLVVKPDSASAVNTEDASRINPRMDPGSLMMKGGPSIRTRAMNFAGPPQMQMSAMNFGGPPPMQKSGFGSAFLSGVKCMMAHRGPKAFTSDFGAGSTKKDSNADWNNGGELYEIAVSINIRKVYKATSIIAKVRNTGPAAQTFTFPVFVPAGALISSALLKANGKIYDGYSCDKDEATDTYSTSVKCGLLASQVHLKDGSSNTVLVSISLPPQTDAEVTVTYEERLVKTNSNNYAVASTIYTEEFDQLLKLMVTISIDAIAPITSLVSQYISNNFITKPTAETALTRYDGPIGDIFKNNQEIVLLEFGVDANSKNNEVLADDGYFINLEPATNIPQEKKLIAFVLNDIIGVSDTLNTALNTVLSQLQTTDIFTVIQSGTQATSQLVPATEENIAKAKMDIKATQRAENSTIGQAFKTAFNLISTNTDYKPLILFLSDISDVNVVENSEVDKITKLNTGNVPIFSILRGEVKFVAAFDGLLNNGGFFRRIYEFSDIQSQLADYYTQLSYVLSLNVNVRDINETVEIKTKDTLTRSRCERCEAIKAVQKQGSGGTATLSPEILRRLKYEFNLVTDSTSLVMT